MLLYRAVALVFFVFSLVTIAVSQDGALGILVNDERALDGYALIAPQSDSLAYMIDNEGRIIKQWDFGADTREMHLLENGNILVVRSAQHIMDHSQMPVGYKPDGGIAEFTWDGELLWEYNFVDARLHQHHGIDVLPNGNVIAIVRQYIHIDDAIDMGLDPAIVEAYWEGSELLLPDIVIELDGAAGEIVWKWDPWNHLIQEFNDQLPNYGDVSEHPERIDINYQSYYLKGIAPNRAAGAADWMHTNMVNYNPVLDQIIISVRSFDEFWIVDRNLTLEEAAGPAGDLLYRWGNPFAFGQGTLSNDRKLFQQHDVQWIDEDLPGAGNILIYNNRNGLVTEDEISEEEYSSVIELRPPLTEHGSYDWSADAEIVWQYDQGFYSQVVSGVQRLTNGNTLITAGVTGHLIEVTPAGDVVWEFVNPVPADGRKGLFRVRKYASDHPGLAGKKLTPAEVLGEETAA